MALPHLLGALNEDLALLVGPASFYPLLAGRFPPDTYVPFEKGGVFGLIRGAAALFRCPVDRAILLPNSFRSALMCLLGGVPRTVGFPTDGRGFLLHRRIPLPGESLHQSQVYRHIMEASGLLLPYEGPCVFPLPASRDRALTYWRQEHLLNKTVVAVHPFSSKEPRTWSPRRFRLLIERLSKEGVVPMILGKPGEREKARAMIEGIKGPFIDLTSLNVDLGDVAAFLERASLFIGNDSGPGHLAAALGIPTITIHGPTSPYITGPKGPHSRYVWSSFPCSPCRERFYKECHPGEENRPPCLEAITVEEVWGEVLKAI